MKVILSILLFSPLFPPMERMVLLFECSVDLDVHSGEDLYHGGLDYDTIHYQASRLI